MLSTNDSHVTTSWRKRGAVRGEEQRKRRAVREEEEPPPLAERVTRQVTRAPAAADRTRAATAPTSAQPRMSATAARGPTLTDDEVSAASRLVAEMCAFDGVARAQQTHTVARCLLLATTARFASVSAAGVQPAAYRTFLARFEPYQRHVAAHSDDPSRRAAAAEWLRAREAALMPPFRAATTSARRPLRKDSQRRALEGQRPAPCFGRAAPGTWKSERSASLRMRRFHHPADGYLTRSRASAAVCGFPVVTHLSIKRVEASVACASRLCACARAGGGQRHDTLRARLLHACARRGTSR